MNGAISQSWRGWGGGWRGWGGWAAGWGGDEALPEGAEQGGSGHGGRLDPEHGGPEADPGEGDRLFFGVPPALGPDQHDGPFEGRRVASGLGHRRSLRRGHLDERAKV